MGITFIDFFAGVGGFRRGMELEGHKCVGFCEFDKFAAASYISMHLITDVQHKYLSTLPIKQRQKEILKDEYRNGEWYANDIRRVDARSLPHAKCWCFGAPCQDFSVAGRRAGLYGERSSLIRQIFRIIGEIKEENRPEWLIYENVKGMLSSNKGFDYLEILLAMDELGYDCEWQLFNSKDWGVPQNRERMYTIGHLRRCGGRKILPIAGTDGENSLQVVGKVDNSKSWGKNRILLNSGISTCLRGSDSKDPVKIAIPVLTPDRAEKRQNGIRFKEDGEPMFTLTSQDRHGVGIEVYDMYNKRIRDDGNCGALTSNSMTSTTHCGSFGVLLKIKEATQKGYQEAGKGDCINFAVQDSKTRRGRVGHGVANTLDTSCSQGIFVQVTEELTIYAIWYEKYNCYIAIRKLTPKECFRIQGWSDDYFSKAEFVNSDSQLYKQAGNGVTVNVVREIAKWIDN